ncbi:hypothetical protein [Bowmanella yangjiangensis]|uniref:Uncharacterized protein n=1 Tax=Bowmanella yangjiangensis TaxID=2811230 RepID=A0ABS3CY28_9ALTE|nr:hypothetical protein [Bowmanella yangjiangensis]MBN7820539.1 hypothetical protein [Bowmanella yangjiangensis]
MNNLKVEFGEFLKAGKNFDELLEHLKRSISAICREGRGVTKFYIGKASGTNATDAIYRRYDSKKSEWELTEVWALFESNCSYLINNLESNLNEHYIKNAPDRCLNTGKGSAGRISAQPKVYIYLSLKRH